MVFSLGFILGPAVEGLLSVYGYAVPTLVTGAVAIIATILTYFFLPESIKINEAAMATVKKQKGFFAYLGFIDIVMQRFVLKRILKWISKGEAIVISIVCMKVALGLITFSSNMPLFFLAVTLLAFGNIISRLVLAGLVSKETYDNEQENIMEVHDQSVGSIT